MARVECRISPSVADIRIKGAALRLGAWQYWAHSSLTVPPHLHKKRVKERMRPAEKARWFPDNKDIWVSMQRHVHEPWGP